MSGVDMTPSIPGWLRTRRIRARSSWRSAIATGSSWILRLARPGWSAARMTSLPSGAATRRRVRRSASPSANPGCRTRRSVIAS